MFIIKHQFRVSFRYHLRIKYISAMNRSLENNVKLIKIIFNRNCFKSRRKDKPFLFSLHYQWINENKFKWDFKNFFKIVNSIVLLEKSRSQIKTAENWL
jgi:hypothetical protein